MRRRIFILVISLYIHHSFYGQAVGIGTGTPDSSALLDIVSTGKGVLFPRMTSAQRNVIPNPANGLLIFNTDDRCINYFDSTAQQWNCFCADCHTATRIELDSSMCGLIVDTAFLNDFTASTSYILSIPAGIAISGCENTLYYETGKPAIQISGLPGGTMIFIVNKGTIAGGGGYGGVGSILSQDPFNCPFENEGLPGTNGGDAVQIVGSNISVHISNHGIIAGGGGGGGGGGGIGENNYGGGGGGGAGVDEGAGGWGGGPIMFDAFNCILTSIAPFGNPGTAVSGGSGGLGIGSGSQGGMGGDRGMPGQNGNGANAGTGGLAGKAIAGGSNNVLINLPGGQSFGVID